MDTAVKNSFFRQLQDNETVVDVASDIDLDVDLSAVPVSDGYTISLSEYYLDECAIELGIYFMLVTFCSFILLDELRGKRK